MSDSVADSFLFFGHEPAYAFFFFLAMLFPSWRKIAIWALALLLFTSTYNIALKNIWQVPLPPSLHKEGYAFPSGHMHAAVVFYGTLAQPLLRLRWILGFLACFFAGFGLALVSRGYHYSGDVLAAFAFGCVSIGVCRLLGTMKFFARNLWSMPLLWLVLGIGIYGAFLMGSKLQGILLGSLGALLGLTLLCFAASRCSSDSNF